MKYLLIALTCLTCLTSCKETKRGELPQTLPDTSKLSKVVPVFNSDSAYSYVAKQVGFGPRIPNTKTHLACAEYLITKLKSYNWTLIEQKFQATAFDGSVLKGINIIASYQPEIKKRILLASHWDSRPFADQEQDPIKRTQPIDGANDGASGVGVLLELARQLDLAKDKPSVGIDIIFFDAEDYGAPQYFKGESKPEHWCLGSQYWSNNKHNLAYSAYYGILLDMVGAKDATFFKEGVSMQYAPSVVNKVWKEAQSKGYGQYFVNDYCGGITDDHTFVNQITGIPMIDIIHYNYQDKEQFFGNYWHTHADNLDAVDPNTLKAVGQTLLEVLYKE